MDRTYLSNQDIINYLNRHKPKAAAPSTPLYHYTSYEAALKILETGTLRYSPIKNLNDPFDLNVEVFFDHSYSNADLRDWISLKFPEASSSDQRSQFLTLKKLKSELEKDSLELNRSFFDKVGIACFSSIYDSVLVWSHYGEKHKGIVLQFEIDSRHTNNFTIAHLNYIKKFKKLPITRARMIKGAETLAYFIFSKSKTWWYEKEIRAVNFLENGDLPFHPKCIKAVYFGLKADNEKVDAFIRKIKTQNRYDLDFFKMELKDESFKITAQHL